MSGKASLTVTSPQGPQGRSRLCAAGLSCIRQTLNSGKLRCGVPLREQRQGELE